MLEKKIINSSKAPKAIGPYSQGVVSNGHIFLSGQIPLDKNGDLNDGTIQEQVELIFENIGHLLETQNCSFQNIIKLTYDISLQCRIKFNTTWNSHMENGGFEIASFPNKKFQNGVKVASSISV